MEYCNQWNAPSFFFDKNLSLWLQGIRLWDVALTSKMIATIPFFFNFPFTSGDHLSLLVSFKEFKLRLNRSIASTLPKLLFYFCRFVNSWKWWMVLQRKMAQVQIHCAEPWVWLSTMMLSVVHQNSMWLMTMPNALLLVQQNVRYVKNIAFVNVVSSFLFFFFFFYFAKYFGMQLLLICCFSYLLAIWDIWCY